MSLICRTRFSQLGSAFILALATAACSSSKSTSPVPEVTLIVTNETCSTGPCEPVTIRAFPTNQPNTPGGLWSVEIGRVTTAYACLKFPETATFSVTGQGRTTTYSWNALKSAALGPQPPGASTIMLSPTTRAFVPAASPGWSLTYPGSVLAPAGACSMAD